MQLNQFKAVAKPRTSWQAVDLGCKIARRWYLQLVVLWLLPASLIFFPLSYLFYDSTYIAATLTWLLKPVFERPLLYVVSRQLFDNSVSLAELKKNYFGLVRFDLIMSLTWRRLSGTRSMDMPITVLERLKGSQRKQRLNILHREFSGTGNWVTIIAVHIEVLFIFGIAAGFTMLLPQGVELNWQRFLLEQTVLSTHIYNTIWFFCAALVAPFYVCAGFAMYLQRRIDIEAWDVEIQFRRLVARKAQLKQNWAAKPPLTIIVLGALLLSSAPDSAYAQLDDSILLEVSPPPPTVTTAAPSNSTAQKTITEIFTTADFSNIENKRGIRLIPQEEQEESASPEWLIRFFEWLADNKDAFGMFADILSTIAKHLEVILWAIVISLILYIAYYYRRFIKRAFNLVEETEELDYQAPEVLFGLEVTEESLPEDVIVAAQEQWQQGKQRIAIGLILRASLVICMNNGCRFNDGNTESECAIIVNNNAPTAPAKYFSLLVAQWQSVAYAHIDCSPNNFSTLCSGYQEVFGSE